MGNFIKITPTTAIHLLEDREAWHVYGAYVYGGHNHLSFSSLGFLHRSDAISIHLEYKYMWGRTVLLVPARTKVKTIPEIYGRLYYPNEVLVYIP